VVETFCGCAPGPTDGSIAIHLAATGVLFTGDDVARQEDQTILGPFNLDRTLAIEWFRDAGGMSSAVSLARDATCGLPSVRRSCC
jgi:hypothetical protein